MVYAGALRAYQKTNVESADNLKLVIMCYEAAINDLKVAKELHEKRQIDSCYDKLRHAQDIITELLVGLDYERGGEIARNLSRLYNFALRQMIGINSRQDTSSYQHLISMLSELKDAWEQVRQSGYAPSALRQAGIA
ncbi:MAG: flagellar export chaperone FliS [Desulforhabdus sp.]|jgi:flagellar protein FliS|nr:flagellar export chaperone FliS [Desulforhabdus sp.]